MLLPAAIHICVFVFYVFFVDVSHAKEEDRLPLVRLRKLAELQTEHCTEALLCTVRTVDDISQNETISCCNPCSCDSDCTKQGTCCPDYRLIDSIGEDISYNMLEFSDRLTTINDVNVTVDPLDQLTCFEASAPKFQKFYEKSKVTYRMVVSCPVMFNGNQEIPTKCEEPQNIGTFEFDLFIPVTSLKSGTTYRNKYCLLCNEESNGGKTDVVYWTSTMYCDFDYHREFVEVTPYDFFTSVMEQKIYYCNLVFSPNTDLDTYRCDMVDIEACPEGSDNQLNEICKSFHLPVTYYKSPWASTRYRNIACYLCNVDAPFNPVCESISGYISKIEPYGLELSIQRDKNNNLMHGEDHEHHLLNVDVIRQEDNVCKTGFIQDASREEATCLNLLCPWNFYISKGECIPTFTRLHDVMFTALLEVRRVELFGKIMIDEIRKNYLKQIAAIGEDMFNEFTYGLWEMQNDYDLLAVSFTTDPSNYNYNAMLRQYTLFLDRVCILTINAESSAVKVSTFQTRSPGQAYSEIPYMFPKPKEIFEYEELDKSLKRLEIHITHLCYRVAVPSSEKLYYTNNHYIYYALQSTKSDEILVCVDDVYKNMTDISSAFMFGGTCAQTAVDFVKNKQKYKTTKIGDDKKNDNTNSNNINDNNDDNDDINNNNSTTITNNNDNNNNNTSNNKNDDDIINNNNNKENETMVSDSGSLENANDNAWSNLPKGLLAWGVVVAALLPLFS